MGVQKHTTESFVEAASVVHNNAFDYSQTHYSSFHGKVKIICPVHGAFEQGAGRHLAGSSCTQCSYKSRAMSRRSSGDVFIEAAKIIHEDWYDYSRVDYKTSKTLVEIVCPNHGSFFQTPNSHVSGKFGCKDCGYDTRLMPTKGNADKFIADAREVHGDVYDYSQSVYTTTHHKLKILCKKHGTFAQTPNNHTSKKQGCPKCVSFQSSIRSLDWIASIRNTGVDIQAADSAAGEYKIPGTRWNVDGFCVETNTVYEFHGDYWHGNPTIYPPMRLHPVIKKPYGELYAATLARDAELAKLGYKVVSIWESDWQSSLNEIPKV